MRFASARALLAWAREDIDQFDEAAEAFFKSYPYEHADELEPNAAYVILKIRIKPVPDGLRKLASHIIWDLKHALDHATTAAVAAIYTDFDGDIYFPWCSSPNDLRSRLNYVPKGSDRSRYPAPLHDVFYRAEPYPTGNGYAGGSDEMCAFSKLANTTKHAVPLSAIPRGHLTGLHSVGGGVIKAFTDAWNPEKHELTVAHVRLGTNLDVQVGLASYIALTNTPAFERHPVGDVFDAIGDRVEALITDLEEATALAVKG